MTYDGGIRLAKWEHGVPWAIGAGEEGVFADIATIEQHVPGLWLTAYWAVVFLETEKRVAS